MLPRQQQYGFILMWVIIMKLVRNQRYLILKVHFQPLNLND